MSFEGDKVKAKIYAVVSALAIAISFTACNEDYSSIPEYQDPEKVVISDRIPLYPTETDTTTADEQTDDYVLLFEEDISQEESEQISNELTVLGTETQQSDYGVMVHSAQRDEIISKLVSKGIVIAVNYDLSRYIEEEYESEAKYILKTLYPDGIEASASVKLRSEKVRETAKKLSENNSDDYLKKLAEDLVNADDNAAETAKDYVLNAKVGVAVTANDGYLSDNEKRAIEALVSNAVGISDEQVFVFAK